MLFIKTANGYLTLDKRQNFNIVYDYEGGQMLSFDLSCADPNYDYVHEDVKIKYGDNRYVITRVNKRRTIATIEAELDMNEWKTRIHMQFETDHKLFSEIADTFKPAGWTFEQFGAAKERFSISLEGVTSYDILMECMNVYGFVVEYHINEKRLVLIDPSVILKKGVYLSDELNVNSVEYKGDFTKQANRLYAYGKKQEKEEGGVTTTTFVSFASINGGKEYVECLDYKDDEIVCAYWQDDKYEDPEALLDEAKTKVKALAYPVQSWSCNVYDVARVNPKYQMLNFKLYDKPVLLMNGHSIEHQVVEYTDYPDNHNLNKVVLSTTFRKIEGEISGIKSNIQEININAQMKESIINEIRRDVNSNTLLIQDTYRKNDVDTKLSSIIQQTENSIQTSVGEVQEKVLELENTRRYHIELRSSNGMVFRNGDIQTQLSAVLYSWDDDITSVVLDHAVTWNRISNDNNGDMNWNKSGKDITITSADLQETAVFECTWNEVQAYITLTNVYDGERGTPGVNGKDGKSTYLHVKYAAVLEPTDEQISEIPNIYIGTYVDQQPEDSPFAGMYTWVKFQGDNGLPGANGSDGKTSYLHIRYSDDMGFTFTANNGKTPGAYIGQYTDFIQTDSILTSRYLWMKIKGADGTDGSVQSDTAPEDKTKLWLDTTIDKLKRWNGTEWMIVNDYVNDLTAVEQSIRESYLSAIELTKSEINVNVQAITESTDDAIVQIKGLKNELSQTSEQTSFIKTTMDKIEDAVNGKVSVEEIKEWARFNGSTLELGASNSTFKAVLSNIELAFWQGNTKVAWISNNEMHIANSIIMEILKVGNWVCRDEGLAGLTWRRM